ncbi:periplasmic metalloprotease M23B family protein [Thalassotalea insulae]|uniref:Periplasmic metalloprotease M23B family protein n=1 Tax=Thalassotalea insulae TaxID=2056778 RepID=A0ABQ6GXF3_9GAMM|nr:M23 family metallopeptidase [Thalassotalea insulae]GLX80354.1 periplasmic metalloprotease M23B family protein [Thalassotalea insulae]
MLRTIISTALLVTSCSLFAQVTLSGDITQGSLVIGKAADADRVTFDGKVLALSAQGDFVFGFSRDDNKSHQLIITYANGKTESKTLTPTKRDYQIQRVEGIAKKIMNPDPKAVARAKNDSRQVKQARSQLSANTAFTKGFVAPIDGVITGVYGSQRFYNGKPKSPHYGLDYAGNTGDPVKAPADGIVSLFVPDMFYSGGTMIIDHGHGVNSTFLHLSDAYVNVGDKVTQGQVVAAVGSSGRATGPHLDWRINWFQVRLDPALALKLTPLK